MRFYHKRHLTARDKASEPEPSGEIERFNGDLEPDPPRHGDTWGRWQFDAKNFALFDTKEWGYWMPVADVADVEGFHRLLRHLDEKIWVSAEDLGDLVRAFLELAPLARGAA